MVRGIVESRTNDDVSSPTFVYHQRYGSTAQPIDHIDLYRVKDDQIKLASSGILDIIETVPGWVLIEWPLNDMKFPPAVPVVTVAASGPPTFRFAITTHDPAILAALSKRV